MDLPDDDQLFLRDLVKISRQKHHHIAWVDRDGTDRMTTVSQTDIVRINKLAHRLHVSKKELMRQAAHIPVGKSSGSSNSTGAALTPSTPPEPIAP
ncbi:MAG: hypothetical protein H7343_13495 [Undibacterium sp.]|nr:hypothetical protein [Opitutaceae bacterium]